MMMLQIKADEDEATDSAKNDEQRISIRHSEKRIANEEEFSDSEDEGSGGRRDVRSHKPKRQKKTSQGNEAEGDAAANDKPAPNAAGDAETKEEKPDTKA